MSNETHKHSIGSKRLSIDAFPKTVFVHLFQYEPTFKYSPTQQKYSCQFKGNEGEERHSIGSKRLSIDAFPKTVFVHLFQYEPTFKYSPTQQKYSCQFKGNEGEERLKQILNYEYWSFRQDPITKTKGYILLINCEEIYSVNFS
ncbi:hypothetical protein Glove_294g122 [Diversispora epigaea]|uniref:Uncharacterized protein n=1 Tax=Diversispora epigaea TaxID=1348612 RepID=A0A397I316_9GLOM|nr:hypothetical protein Glove_294g122 [Diversispora epigaea]